MKKQRFSFWDGFVVGFVCALVALILAYSKQDRAEAQNQNKTPPCVEITVPIKGPNL